MNDIKFMVTAISNKEGLEEGVIYSALEEAFASATIKETYKDYDETEILVNVDIDRKTGGITTYRSFRVVDSVENDLFEIDSSDNRCEGLEVGQHYQELIGSISLGSRIVAKNINNVFMQKVRDATRDNSIKNILSEGNKVVTVPVKQPTKEYIIFEFQNNVEGLLPRDEMLPKEIFRPGDRTKVYITGTAKNGKKLSLSRTNNEFLRELFAINVPEVDEGIIEVMSAARDPGFRAKVSVKTNDGRIDPQGACIGVRGTRVQAISNELKGERIDIVLWNEDPVTYVMNALSPAEIVAVDLDEEKKSMHVTVSDDKLAQAIGKNGQNVILASKLTGWHLNVIGESEAMEAKAAEHKELISLFTDKLGVSAEQATTMVDVGFSSLEEAAYISVDEMKDILQISDKEINILQSKAKEHLQE